MWGVLLVLSSSPTLTPIHDGLDVNVTSNVSWFHINHDMVPHRIFILSCYGGNSITFSSPGNQRMSTKHPGLERGSKVPLFETNEDEAVDSPTPRNVEP